MSRKSYPQLNNALSVCRKRFLDLATDPDYQITTWRAKDYVMQDMIDQGYNIHFLVLVQIQDFENQQAEHGGQEDFANKIRAICKISSSSPNIVMRVRCSEDEILFFLSETWVFPMTRLKQSLLAAGIGAIAFHKEFSYGSIPDALRTMQAVAQARKEGYKL